MARRRLPTPRAFTLNAPLLRSGTAVTPSLVIEAARVGAFTVVGRGPPLLCSVFKQEGEETPQPILGVGRGVAVDGNHTQIREVPAFGASGVLEPATPSPVASGQAPWATAPRRAG